MNTQCTCTVLCLSTSEYCLFFFRKKKKKKNKAEEVVETIKKIEETKEMKEMDKRTPAQIAYDKVKEQRVRNFVTGYKLCVCYSMYRIFILRFAD